MNKAPAIVVNAFKTPIRIKPEFWGVLAALWAAMTWMAGHRQPNRSSPQRIAMGFLSMLALISADVGHAVAHIFSARAAGAPMDEIVLAARMPATVYHDSDVPPRDHRTRALGGPVFSGVGLAIALGAHRLTPRDSGFREVLGWSAIGHGLIFAGSLAPLPFVDGGSLLKWTLVARGATEEAADATVRRVDLSLGASLAGTGLVLLAKRRRNVGLGLIAAGLFTLATGLGKIRQI